MQCTVSAPRRSDTRSASIAVLPAPITATCLPGCSGVSKFGKSRARIRLQRVRSSLADSTPFSDLAGDAHEARVARAGADEHRVEAHLGHHLLDA